MLHMDIASKMKWTGCWAKHFMDTQDCETEKVAGVWLTNSSFGSNLKRSVTKFQDAKLQIDMFSFHVDNPQSGDEETRLSD